MTPLENDSKLMSNSNESDPAASSGGSNFAPRENATDPTSGSELPQDPSGIEPEPATICMAKAARHEASQGHDGDNDAASASRTGFEIEIAKDTRNAKQVDHDEFRKPPLRQANAPSEKAGNTATPHCGHTVLKRGKIGTLDLSFDAASSESKVTIKHAADSDRAMTDASPRKPLTANANSSNQQHSTMHMPHLSPAATTSPQCKTLDAEFQSNIARAGSSAASTKNALVSVAAPPLEPRVVVSRDTSDTCANQSKPTTKLNAAGSTRADAARAETYGSVLSTTHAVRSSAAFRVPAAATTAPTEVAATVVTRRPSAPITRHGSGRNRSISLSSQNSQQSTVASLPLDPLNTTEDAWRSARAPLTDLFGPYIVSSDSSLQDARHRLQTALEQCLTLRKAFTERVYGKYRVCLRPPPSIGDVITAIRNDPATYHRSLREQILSIKAEKEIEKKEAAKTNAEWGIAGNTMNDTKPKIESLSSVENAEHLMYMTAGLNLVILPEQEVSASDLKDYAERSPVNPSTGQRVKNISHAAATAGEVVLERTRKAAEMRIERQRLCQLKLLQGEPPVVDETRRDTQVVSVPSHGEEPTKKEAPLVISPVVSEAKLKCVPLALSPLQPQSEPVARPMVFEQIKEVAAPVPTPPHPAPKPAAPKTNRSRLQAALAPSALLSLSPSAEEIKYVSGKPCAATMALITCGVGSWNAANSSRSTQQRLRHPHPESRGGRRRASVNLSKKDHTRPALLGDQPPYPQGNLDLALPPLPGVRERLERQQLPVLTVAEASTQRSTSSIRTLLECFLDPNDPRVQRRQVTKIGFMNNIRKLRAKDPAKQVFSDPFAASESVTSSGSMRANGAPIDQILTYSVLRAVGLVTNHQSTSGLAVSLPPITESQSAWSERLVALRDTVMRSDETVASLVFRDSMAPLRKRGADSANDIAAKRARFDDARETEQLTVPVESIRGGGDLLVDAKDDNGSASGSNENGRNRNEARHRTGQSADPTHPTDDQNAERSYSTAPRSLLIRPLDQFQAQANRVNREAAQLAFLNSQLASGVPTVAASNVPALIPAYPASPEHYAHASAMNAMHLASQLRHMNHHAGDLADYLGSLQQQGYDVSALLAGTGHQTLAQNQAQLTALSLGRHNSGIVNYAMQERAATARAILAREQHAMTMMTNAAHSYVPPSVQAFQHVGTHSAALSALLAPQTPVLLNQGGLVGPALAHVPSALTTQLAGPPSQMTIHPPLAHASLSSASRHTDHEKKPRERSHSGDDHKPRHKHRDSVENKKHHKIDPHQDSSSRTSDRGRQQTHLGTKVQHLPEKDGIEREKEQVIRIPSSARSVSSDQAQAVFDGNGNLDMNAKPAFHEKATDMAAASAMALSSFDSGDNGNGDCRSSTAATTEGSDCAEIKQRPSRVVNEPDVIGIVPSSARDVTTAHLEGAHEASLHLTSNQVEGCGEAKVPPEETSQQAAPAENSKVESETTPVTESEPRKPPSIDKVCDRAERDCSLKDAFMPEAKEHDCVVVDSPPANETKDTAVRSQTVDDDQDLPPPDDQTADLKPHESPDVEARGASLMPSKSDDEPSQIKCSESESAVSIIAQNTGSQALDAAYSACPSPPSSQRLTFDEPEIPPFLSPSSAALIRGGSIFNIPPNIDSSELVSGIQYLEAVGSAVPIPKTLVSNVLKERMNTPGFKTLWHNGAPLVSRETVAAAILVWIWAHHEPMFQEAFQRHGRLDVDHDCKWVVQAAVDTSIRELSYVIAESLAKREGPFAEAAVSGKSPASGMKTSLINPHEPEPSHVPIKLRFYVASIVSKSLAQHLAFDSVANAMLPRFQPMLQYLDEARLCALRAKSQERVLLANLVARKATMTESFSHAYVSAMVRAGEALGHGKLFEMAQNEDVRASTMIPFDVLTDDSGAWEDPCKTDECFTPGLFGDELIRRAHARAMIHKSLRKLQDRHSIRGGTTSYGPYVDPSDDTSQAGSAAATDISARSQLGSSRHGTKRRISAISEPPVPPGTGSAEAKSWSLYEPKNFSEPLDWDASHLGNTPYGRHRGGDRPRSISLSVSSRSGEPRITKKARRTLANPAPPTGATNRASSGCKTPQSTKEIEWVDVAGIFQSVELPRKPPPSRSSHSHHDAVPTKPGATIFAPYCRKVHHDFPSDNDADSDEELNDDAVLEQHQLVLDEMKGKLSAFLEARRRHQDRRKHKSNR